MSKPSQDLPTLPTAEQLSERWTALSDAVEKTETALRPVFEAINFDGEQDVTYEHIATLAVFARDLQLFGRQLQESGRKLEHVTLEDLEGIRRDGDQASIPHFDRYGLARKKDPDVFFTARIDKLQAQATDLQERVTALAGPTRPRLRAMEEPDDA